MTYTKKATRDRALKIMVNVRAPLAEELNRLERLDAMRVGSFRSVPEKTALRNARLKCKKVDKILSALAKRFAEAA
jgi:hypothetical protein